MDWLSRVLISALVVTGIFVAVTSGCQPFMRALPEGGSCSQTIIEPQSLIGIQTVADVPPVRIEFTAVLVAIFLLVVPHLEIAFPSDRRNRARGSPRRIPLVLRD